MELLRYKFDIKIDGLTYDIIEQAFERTKIARDYILDEIMAPVIEKPRDEISKYAPRILTATISTDKIKDVIGPGGKMINKIIDATGVKIDISDDGKSLHIFYRHRQWKKKSYENDNGHSKRNRSWRNI